MDIYGVLLFKKHKNYINNLINKLKQMLYPKNKGSCY